MQILRRALGRGARTPEESLVFEHAPQERAPDAGPPAFVVRELGDDDISELFGPRGIMRRRVPAAELRRRRDRGDRAIGAFADGQVAHVSWLMMTRVIAPEEAGEGRSVTLPREVAYLYHCLTLPQYRRKGAYAAVLTAFLSWPGLENVQRFIACSPQNDASRRAIEKAGFTLHTRLNPRHEP